MASFDSHCGVGSWVDAYHSKKLNPWKRKKKDKMVVFL